MYTKIKIILQQLYHRECLDFCARKLGTHTWSLPFDYPKN